MGTNKTIVQSRRVIALTLAVCSSLLVSGCFGKKPAPSAPAQSCSEAYEKTVHAEVKGGHLYFKVDDLEFLSDKSLVLEDIELSATLSGKHDTQRDIYLSLNGIKVSRKDGQRHLDRCEYEGGGDTSRPFFKLHKFFLNGGEPFHLFMAKLKKNKGVLKVSLLGHDKHILAAALSFSGKKYTSCPAPTPEPEPEIDIASSIDLVEPSENVTASTDIKIGFSANIENSTFWCSLDGSSAAQCTSPVSYTGLANGSHNFSVYAKSPKGVVEDSPESYAWTVDSEPPSVTIANRDSLPAMTNGNSISFDFVSNEAAAFQCQIDDQIPSTCSSPITYSSLGEGIHTFKVHGIDSVGNAGVPATFQWTIDQTPPIASIVEVSPAGSINNSNSKSFNFGSNESSRFECSVDNGPFAACESPVSFSGLAEGHHWFEVRAIDVAGNTGLGASYAWGVDTIAPSISFATVIPASGVTNAKSVFASFNLSEPTSVICSWDGGTGTECPESFTATDISEGSHSLSVYAEDAAGNRSSNISVSWTMDHSAPILSFGVISPSGSAINSSALSAEVNSSSSATLNVTLNHMSVDQASSPIVLTGLTEGSYVLTVTATDEVGNVSNPISHSFTVDLTTPTLSLAVDNRANPANSDSNSFSFAASEAASFECNMDEAGFHACLSPFAAAGLADGEHNFQVRASDAAGNVSAISSHSWIIDTIAPSTMIAANPEGNFIAASSITFSLSSNESGVSFSCSFDGGTSTTCGTSASYSGLAEGAHKFVAYAVDAAGNVGGSSTYDFTVITPVTTNILAQSPEASPTNITTRSISFESNIVDASFVCSINGSPESACSSPVDYSDLVHGVYNFNVVAIDSHGNRDPVGATATWVIDTVAPVVTALTTSATSTTITVTWSTDESTTRRVVYGANGAMNRSTVESTTYSTSHSVMLTGLTRNTLYSIQVSGKDAAGNPYTSTITTRRTSL
jgi:large repetitive protein